MYIVIILVTCHSIRLVPTIWEIIQTVRLHWGMIEERSWPAWVDIITGVSHLTLTISSSLSFYIYSILYGSKHKVEKTSRPTSESSSKELKLNLTWT